MLLSLLLFALIAYLGNFVLRSVLAVYTAFIIFDKTPERGGWGKWGWFDFFQDLTIWKYFADYFGASLIVEGGLDPQKPYVFAYHPHGIISLGAGMCFLTKSIGFHKTGISTSLLALAPIFKIPFFREWMLAHGAAPCGGRTCDNILSTGRSIALVVGGASESLEARPGTLKLTLASRRGFVRVAIRNGANIVPVLAFGENELFEQLDNAEGTTVRWIQEKSRKLLSFALPFFYGRGIFQYWFGTLPHRYPITVVIGKPVMCSKESPPTAATVAKVHAAYMAALKALHVKYKDACAGPAGAPEIEFR